MYTYSLTALHSEAEVFKDQFQTSSVSGAVLVKFDDSLIWPGWRWLITFNLQWGLKWNKRLCVKYPNENTKLNFHRWLVIMLDMETNREYL